MARRGGKAHNRKKGERTPSGQLSRSKSAKRHKEREARQWAEMTEREAREVVIAQRLKAGMSEKDAKDNKASTVQGALHLMKRITWDEHTLCEWYLEQRNMYLIARNSPDAHYETPEGRSASGDPERYVEFCKSATGRWNAIEAAIVKAVFAKKKPEIVGALDMLLVRQRLQLELVPPLRLGLAAISDIYTGKAKKQAA